MLDGLEEGQYDAALGGGRRDEEKARAKERFFSHRDALVSGTLRTKDLNCGMFLMVKTPWRTL